MSDQEIPVSGRVLVPGAHRLIRMLDEQEGPYAGTLVSRADGVAVQADAESLSGWQGWSHAGAEHVAAPLDLVRRETGHDVLLPWCPERVTVFLGRRAAAGVVLSAGEMATLVGSLLRGLEELDGGSDVLGGWWLTDDGRPVFAFGDGESARASAARLVARLQEGSVDRALGRLLSTVQQGLEQPRVARRVTEEWERDLLAYAAPRPLQREVFAPAMARDIAMHRPVQGVETEPRSDRHAWTVGAGLLRQAAERVRSASAHLHPASKPRSAPDVTPVPRRRRALLLAGAAAAAVLAIGLLWPSGASEEAGAQVAEGGVDGAGAVRPASDEPEADETVEADAPQSRAAPAPSEEADAAEVTPVEAAADLLQIIRECEQSADTRCADAVAEGSTGVVPRLGGDRSGEELALVEDYGDIAVIRLTPTHSSPQDTESELMLVLVRSNENWLVRDVYGVADQPG